MTKRILVTGMSGLIGGAVRKRLEGRYRLTALNRSLVPGVQTVQADIADFDAIRPAFENQEAVVHLAASARGLAPWEHVRDPNLIGTYNVFEAARQAGVGRVVFASSGSTISGWENVQPYRALVSGDYDKVMQPWPMITHEQVRPRGLYGASKVWGEAVGRYFSDEYDLSILCVRIGSVPASGKPETVMGRSIYLSHQDVVRILTDCIDAPDDLRYDIFLATSGNRFGYRDLDHAREVLGWEPADSADTFP